MRFASNLQARRDRAGTLLPMLQAVSQTDTSPVVRVPSNDPAVIMKASTWRVQHHFVTMINSAEEAAKAVSACRLPPRGITFLGPDAAITHAGADYLAKATRNARDRMVETKGRFANIDAICAPGLDAIYIGTVRVSRSAIGKRPS